MNVAFVKSWEVFFCGFEIKPHRKFIKSSGRYRNQGGDSPMFDQWTTLLTTNVEFEAIEKAIRGIGDRRRRKRIGLLELHYLAEAFLDGRSGNFDFLLGFLFWSRMMIELCITRYDIHVSIYHLVSLNFFSTPSAISLILSNWQVNPICFSNLFCLSFLSIHQCHVSRTRRRHHTMHQFLCLCVGSPPSLSTLNSSLHSL